MKILKVSNHEVKDKFLGNHLMTEAIKIYIINTMKMLTSLFNLRLVIHQKSSEALSCLTVTLKSIFSR